MHARHARSSAEAKPAIIAFNRPASALAMVNRIHPQNVDKPVHKRFTETSQWLSAMGHVALPKNTAREQVADFTTRF